jgi:WD40 repeat protein
MRHNWVVVHILGCLGLTFLGWMLPLAQSAEEPKLRSAFKAHVFGVSSMAYSPDGKTLASTGSDGMIKLWDAATGKEQAALLASTSPFTPVAYSPDGKTLASADVAVSLWDVARGKEKAVLKGHSLMVSSAAFSPDGKELASGSLDKSIKLWDVATGKELATLKRIFDTEDSHLSCP